LIKLKRILPFYLILLFAWLPETPASSQQDEPRPVELISIAPDGLGANDWSVWPALSGDGALVAFTSLGSNLVDQDTNTAPDIFLRDLKTRQTRRISVTSQGHQASAASFRPSISADGRIVVFTSLAGDLTGPYEQPDTNGLADIYLHDRDYATTQRISLATGGQQVSGWSDQPAISASGRYVVYASTAPGLDTEDPDNQADIFLYDHQEGETRLVSILPGSDPQPGEAFLPTLSADGRYIAYYFRSEGLVNLYLYDQISRRTWPIPLASGMGSLLPPGWQISPPALSPNGRLLTWVAIGAGQASIYQFDRQTQITNRLQDLAFLSASPMAPAISYTADNRQMVFSLGGSLYRFEPGSSQRLQALENRAGYSGPTGAAVSLDGGHLAFSAFGPQGLAVYSVEQEQAYRSRTVISGWVSDGLGNPLVGITVAAGDDLLTTTSEDGSYTFFDLPEGDYAITPEMQGYTFSPPRWRIFVGTETTNYLGLGFTGLPQEAVAAARQDIGMPYSLSRGCDSPFIGCDGPYYGFFSGDCTDLVIDAYRAGLGIDLQIALESNFIAHPRHYYRWRNIRSAQDMWRFFAYSGLVLSPDDPYQPGDVVFFDWEIDGIIDHVAIISEVSKENAPQRMIDATGIIDENPAGNAIDLEWKPYHTEHSPGHARWLISPPAPPETDDQAADLLIIALDSPVIQVHVKDSLDRTISADALEIPGSSWLSTGAGQVLTLADPLTQSEWFYIELKAPQKSIYQLGLQVVQGAQLIASTAVTGTLAAGESTLFPVQLQVEENSLVFRAPALNVP